MTTQTRTLRSIPWGSIVRYTLMTILALIFLFPIVFMLMSSLKPDLDLLRDALSLRAFLPVGNISFDNYQLAFERAPVPLFIFNSVLVTSVTVLLGLVVNSMAGFALAIPRWRGQGVVLSVIIATLIVPFETIAIPLLLVVNQLPWIGPEGVTFGWLNSYQVQIIPFVASAFSIFLFVQFFKGLPPELIEAARIDGASWFQIYTALIVPLSGPVFATNAILTFLPMWNSFLCSFCWEAVKFTVTSLRIGLPTASWICEGVKFTRMCRRWSAGTNSTRLTSWKSGELTDSSWLTARPAFRASS